MDMKQTGSLIQSPILTSCWDCDYALFACQTDQCRHFPAIYRAFWIKCLFSSKKKPNVF